MSSTINRIDATPEVLHNMIVTVFQPNKEQVSASVLDGVPVSREDTHRERLIDVNDRAVFRTAQSVLDIDGYASNLPVTCIFARNAKQKGVLKLLLLNRAYEHVCRSQEHLLGC